ncbi:hypothetical protein MPSEU_001040200 [Mayamaea pseudoterrestris]|nr:hypothetical protein MPSEU_001040200 [Mayamaea pseudoterrestris]
MPRHRGGNKRRKGNEERLHNDAWNKATRGRRPRDKKAVSKQERDEIEDQLRRQRLKQKKVNEEKDQSLVESTERNHTPVSHSHHPIALGNYLYDRERQTYFPKGFIPRQEEKDSANGLDCALTCCVPARFRTFPYLRLTNNAIDCEYSNRTGQRLSTDVAFLHRAASCDARQRARLAACLAEQSILKSFHLTPPIAQCRVGKTTTKRYYLLFGLNEREARAGNSECKMLLPPWSRTFDVAPHCQGHRRLPNFASVIEEDSVRYLDTLDKTWSYTKLSNQAISSVRFCYPGVLNAGIDQSLPYGVLSSRRGATQTFQILSTLREASWEIVGYQANDFLMLDSDTIVFAFDRTRGNSTNEFFLSINIGSGELTGSQRNSTSSDAICVDTAEPESRTDRSIHTCIFGHRDGSVTLFDKRCSHSSIVKHADNCFGNVLALNCFLPNQVLARGGASGSCRLLDLRLPRKVVKEYAVPSKLVHEHLTQKCNGVTIDPCNNVVISPFVNTNMQPRFGIWSFRSGEYLGSQPLTRKVSATNKQSVVVELCKTPTRAWDWLDEELSSAHLSVLNIRPGAFGLWYKLAYSVDDPLKDNANNIHHASFSGRADDNWKGATDQ